MLAVRCSVYARGRRCTTSAMGILSLGVYYLRVAPSFVGHEVCTTRRAPLARF